MLIKCQLRIECQTEMFMFGQLFNNDVIKKISEDGLVCFFCKRISPQLLAYSHQG